MKKIKKQRPKTSEEIPDPNLDEVGEDRGFEIEEDEETNEVVFVMHYRRKWGDDIDTDTEHALNYEEAGEMVGAVIQIMERIKNRVMMRNALEKSTPVPIEGNPMKGSRIADMPGSEESK
jgi:hypothetical protein